MYKQESKSAIELLKKIVSIPSHSREEYEVADFLERYINNCGQKAKRYKNNVWITSPNFDLHKPTLLLNSHIDTVKPVNGWQYTPYEPTEKDGRIYGLGSNDAGASVVSLLHTFLILIEKKQPYNLIFAASAEEEISGKNGIETFLKQLPKIDFAVVGEPTQMQPAIAEKGLLVLDVIVKGKSGHAARNEGDNAIYKSIEIVNWFKNYKFEKISNTLGEVKMSVTEIEAGTQHNVVPDTCKIVVDIRTNELYSNTLLLDIISSNLPNYVECKARSTRLNSSSTSADSQIVQRAIALGKLPFGSPTLSDQALMNFPTIKIGPGDSSRSHTADEYIVIDEIVNGIELYVKLLDQLNIK